MPKHDKPSAEEPEDRELDIAPIVELTAETLRGDVRNSILDFIKAMPKSWAYMSEAERRDVANSLDRYSFTLVKEACTIIASKERPCVTATLVEYKEKGKGVEAKLKLSSTAEVVESLHGACSQDVLLVTSGFDVFNKEGEKAEALVPGDQSALPLHPDDDSDLAAAE